MTIPQSTQDIAQRKILRLTLYGIVGNLSLAILKGVSGVIGHSYALTADAIESTTDVFSSALLLVGLWFSRLPADDNHPYGHGRAESLATFVVVAFLLGSATLIVFKSVTHIITPHKTPAPFTLVVLAIVIVIKEAFYRLFAKQGNRTQSNALVAEAWHHRSDALTSGAAFIGISIALLMGEGWESADDWAALFAAGIIYMNAYRIFRPTLGEMMDEDTHDPLRESVMACVIAFQQVQEIKECLVRKTGRWYLVDLTLAVPQAMQVAQTDVLIADIKHRVMTKHPQIVRLFIEISAHSPPSKPHSQRAD